MRKMHKKCGVFTSFLRNIKGTLHHNWAANGGYGWNLPFRNYNIYIGPGFTHTPQRGSLYGGGGGRRYLGDCVKRMSRQPIFWCIFDPLCERYPCIISLIPLKKYCVWNNILLKLPTVFIKKWYKKCWFLLKFCQCPDQILRHSHVSFHSYPSKSGGAGRLKSISECWKQLPLAACSFPLAKSNFPLAKSNFPSAQSSLRGVAFEASRAGMHVKVPLHWLERRLTQVSVGRLTRVRPGSQAWIDPGQSAF